VTPTALTSVALALFGGGSVWLFGREIARQVGETKREKIRQDAETMRLTIACATPRAEDRALEPAPTLKEQAARKKAA
jgi:hypothetical protein